MRIARSLWAGALAVAAVASASSTARAQWSPAGIYTAESSSLMFEFVSRNASFQHYLGIFEYNGGSPLFVESIFSAPPDSPGATRMISGLTVGSEYVLGLYTPDALDRGCAFFFCGDNNTPTTYFSDGTSSPGELPGSSGNFLFAGALDANGAMLIGIEDNRDGSSGIPPIFGSYGPSDNDFNDMVVSATVVTPEPGTVALLGTGLLALGGFGLKRRRQNAA
jgi:hypothetical protein